MRSTLCTTALALALAGGCKNGLVPGNSFETSPDVVTARLMGPLPEGTHPIMTVIWTDPLERRPDVAMPAKAIDSTVMAAMGTTMGADNVGTPFTLSLFRPPPTEAMVDIPSYDGHDVARLAMGELAIVDDVDGDGTVHIDGHGNIIPPTPGGAQERYLGFSAEVLFYVERAFPAAIATDFGLLPGTATGYLLAAYACDGRRREGTALSIGARLEPQTALEVVPRRSCMRTHSP